MKLMKTEDAVGQVLCHDITQRGILYLCMQVLMNVLAVCGNGKHPTIFIHPSIPLKRER